MQKKERQIETPYIKEFSEKHHFKLYEMENNIEGGDVLHLYEITKTDADNFGTNFVNLGNKKVLCSNMNVADMLNNEGCDVQYIDYSEINKNEGSLGCSILYLNRNRKF